MQKKCLKCGHVAEMDALTQFSQCPACDVFYHKFEAQIRVAAEEQGITIEQYLEQATEAAEQQRRDAAVRASREQTEQKRSQESVAKAKTSGDWRGVLKADEQKALSQMVATTTHFVPGREVVDVAGIVSAECAFGMNLIFDFFADVRDFVGGRSRNVQKVLRDARQTAINELKKEAMQAGGDAVIGVDLDYSEFSGKGKSMLFVVATGTAVVTRKTEPKDQTSSGH